MGVCVSSLMLLAAAAAMLGASATSAAPPQAVTKSGVVVGIALSNGVDEFVGIPYAAPPNTTELRWQPPTAPAPWTDTPLQATSFGAKCAQAGHNGAPPSGSEDCLTINVWRPSSIVGQVAGARAAMLPVLVWIHGGGYEGGASSLYNASTLVAVRQIRSCAFADRSVTRHVWEVR
jgi:carboxylesterase type B